MNQEETLSSNSNCDEINGDGNKRKGTSENNCDHQKLEFVRRSTLYMEIRSDQLPIVYHPRYNVSLYGIEKFHPFDARKWERTYNKLIRSGIFKVDQFVHASEATQDDLRVVHAESYLKSLNSSFHIARYVELFFAAFIPSHIINRCFLTPMRYQTGGSILAGKLALDRGWAINIGGGFHHASAQNGGGFCVYADITLSLEFLFLKKLINRAVIIDLDAHQGNGHERDFRGNNRVYILDMFNCRIYPRDRFAQEAIRRPVPLDIGTSDDEYLLKLERNLCCLKKEFPSPDIIVYNAGTDCLDKDKLGLLSLSPSAIVKRDEIVFEFAKRNKIPIFMLTSGGYMRSSYEVIAQSILNLHSKKLICY